MVKTIVIGGVNGIGLDVTIQLAKAQGSNLVIIDRMQPDLEMPGSIKGTRSAQISNLIIEKQK